MMRRLFIVGLLLAISGCAPREVTYFLYPGLDRPADRESHLVALAERECAKYGMVLIPRQWRGWNANGQETLTFTCQEHPARGQGFLGKIFIPIDQLPN
ncbi:hypothetical protein [uncultured Rhodoblastus sp.]|uniref:hypothetical protein n=1 Tax=uncultured Rhodoblastus sp. TaxID=543037 RepID=UPI0025D58109|nr:hypothetical protein [uncultured Rhodoblastus sp.]